MDMYYLWDAVHAWEVTSPPLSAEKGMKLRGVTLLIWLMKGRAKTPWAGGGNSYQRY